MSKIKQFDQDDSEECTLIAEIVGEVGVSLLKDIIDDKKAGGIELHEKHNEIFFEILGIS